MSLEIKLREKDNIQILDIEGRLVVGEETSKFRETVNQLVAQDRLNLVLNLAEVEYIDSTGLGAVVFSSTGVKKAGGAMKLLNLNRRNIELLVMTKLTTIFEIFQDEQDAVNSFYPDRKIQTFDILNFIREQENK